MCHSHIAPVLGAALVFLSGVAVGRQAVAQTGYPTKEEVTAALKDVGYGIRRFEEVTDRINFSRWNLSYHENEVLEKYLKTAREELRATKTAIARIENSQEPSTLDVFRVFDSLYTISMTADGLAKYSSSSKDSGLAIELLESSTTANNIRASFGKLVWKSLDAQEAEIKACRSQAR